MSVTEKAEQNLLSHIKNNTYPGRGIVIGRMEKSDNFAIVYFIMGRSVNSQNRRFSFEGERLWTEPVDESKVTDPSLIIYDAMLALPKIQLVSNGDQTTTIYNGLKNGGTFTDALSTRNREPDGPNFTPRISGMISFKESLPKIEMSILRANSQNSDETDRITFMPALPQKGTGYALTTYMGDGNPLPPFNTYPIILPLTGTIDDILNTYWNALDNDNKVSLAVKEVGTDGSVVKIVTANIHS
ncbi:MAG: inosine monophosphate cyclohydrolase [Deltaproteobacteria bacterium]|nr:inosine monophosphate cyclohydrolase [Deltaproteobacteria bacterium]